MQAVQLVTRRPPQWLFVMPELWWFEPISIYESWQSCACFKNTACAQHVALPSVVYTCSSCTQRQNQFMCALYTCPWKIPLSLSTSSQSDHSCQLAVTGHSHGNGQWQLAGMNDHSVRMWKVIEESSMDMYIMHTWIDFVFVYMKSRYIPQKVMPHVGRMQCSWNMHMIVRIRKLIWVQIIIILAWQITIVVVS